MATKFVNSQKIEDFIKANNLSKTKFCKLSGISYSTLNLLLTNDTHLSLKPVCRVAKFMNVEFVDLLK